MSFIQTPVFHFPPSADVRQQLGNTIARYGLFGFLDSKRSSSDLMPYVQASLPSTLKSSVDTVMAQLKATSQRTLSKRLVTSLIGGALSLLAPLSNDVLGTADSISGILLHGLNHGPYSGNQHLVRDPRWGTTTVRTDSFQGDLAWSTNISVGSSSQSLRVNFDTGSADLFFFDPSCDQCSLANHSAYEYHGSTSFSNVSDITFSSEYADGTIVDGYLAEDLVSIGGTVRVKKQLFGMAKNVSEAYGSLEVDGLMGIGPDGLSTFNVDESQGVFSRLVSDKTLASPLIGMALVKGAEENDAHHGEFSFGVISDKWIRGGRSQLAWKNVTSHNFWGIDLSGIFVDGFNVMSTNDPPRAIIDTGTSLTVVSVNAAAAIHSKIPGALMDTSNGVWRVPCSISHNYESSKPTSSAYSLGQLLQILPDANSAVSRHIGVREAKKRRTHHPLHQAIYSSSPNIFFEFGTREEKFGIPASDLAYQQIPADDPNSKSEDGTKMCYSGIQSGADGFVVLGDTFIKNHYIVLKYDDDGQKCIGIGNRTDVAIMD